jgi:hypothetical protein
VDSGSSGDDEEAVSEAPKARHQPRFRPSLDLQHIAVPNWQGIVVLASLLVLGGAAIVAGVEPALVFFALIVGVGFTVIPILTRRVNLPRLPRPPVALPAIGPPRLADRMPRSAVDTDTLRVQTEAMLARWRQGVASPGQEPMTTDQEPQSRTPVRPRAHPAPSDQPNHAETERLRESLRRSTEAIKARQLPPDKD